MPACLRAHGSRAASSRPYDRRSPTASPTYASPDTQEDKNKNEDEEVVIPPDYPGLPTYADYKRIEANYLHSLSPRKRDKALITQTMFDKIWDVLHQPDACVVETPQFRFWVRKMFTLGRPERESPVHTLGDADVDLERSMGIGSPEDDETSFTAVVLHEHRPVAIMEQLYELFCYCHVRAGHGGRDKTCAVIREHYSWVPKELTAQFVKACPTCLLKRCGHGGVGLDVAHRRAVGRGRGRRGATPLEVGAEEVSGPSLTWPTTGGPLDPANPEPCGVREREQEWLRVHGDGGGVGPSSSVSLSPTLDSRMSREAPLESWLVGGWDGIPRALSPDGSPFRKCDTTHCDSFATMKSNQGDAENRSPIKTSLPSLTTALSNESLDEHVSLTNGCGDAAATECVLPPALRPLRLPGPISSNSDVHHESELELSYPFQIDPVLLSFDYPGLGLDLSSESGASADPMPSDLGTTAGAGLGISCREQGHGTTDFPSYGFYRPHARSDTSMSIPALDPDSPNSSFEHGASSSYMTAAASGTLALESLSAELEARSPIQSRCGSRYESYGYRDGPFAMLHHSVDNVKRQLDGPLTFSI